MTRSSPSDESAEPEGAEGLSSRDAALFGFDGDEDGWLERLRGAEQSPALGSIGGYVVEEEVGRGGQGVVFRAVQPATRRTVALKRLRAGVLASERARRRFEREIEAVALLDHPGIVTVYGVELVDDLPVLAMEWIEGVPFTEWTRGRGTREVLQAFHRVCDAVRHAHARGVLHRDLKPSNVLVDGAGRPRVLDFGLAKIVGEGEGPTLTGEGFLGTPGYASPEQLEGGTPDVQSDVFALGVLFFEALTERRPWGEAPTPADTREAMERAPFPRPSRIVPDLDPELDTIVAKALALSPAARYATVDALAEDVRRHLAGEPILAHPPSRAYRARKFVARHRRSLAVGVTGLGLLVGWTVDASVRSVSLARERDDALAARLEAREAEKLAQANETRALLERDRAQTIKDYVLGSFVSQGDAVAGDPNRPMVDVLLSLAGRVEEDLGHLPELEADLSHWLASGLERLGRTEDAEEMVRHALALYRGGVDDPEAYLVTLCLQADIHVTRYDLEQADEILREIDGLVEAHDFPPESLSFVHEVRGGLEDARRHPARAEAEWRTVLELVRAVEGTSRLGRLRELNALGNLLEPIRIQGRPEEALALTEEALRLAEELDTGALVRGNLLASRAATRIELGRTEEAVADYRRAVELLERDVDPGHYVLTSCRVTLARALADLRDPEALDAAVLALASLHDAPRTPDTARLLSATSNLLFDLGRPQEALEAIRAGEEILREDFPDHPRLYGFTVRLGRALLVVGELDEAWEILDPALERFTAGVEGPDPDPELSWAGIPLGESFSAFGRFEDADLCFGASLELLRRAREEGTDVDLENALALYAQHLRRARRPEEAAAVEEELAAPRGE